MNDLKSSLGAMFLCGFVAQPTLPAGFHSLLSQNQLGGIILFARNYDDLEQLKKLTAAVTAVREDSFIAVDQEGGNVVRFTEDFPTYPSSRYFGRRHDPQGLIQSVTQTARQLRPTGVNLNLIPVCDLAPDDPDHVIYSRTYSPDPEEVASIVTEEISCLKREGIMGCAKHFPGLQSACGDPHTVVAVSQRSRDQFRCRDYLPFRAAIASGVEMVMVTHLKADSLDPDNLATFSRKIIDGELRVHLGFAGLIVTDDLQMGAVANIFSPVEAATRAIMAGCDILLYGNLEEGLEELIETICHRAESDERLVNRIAESAARIEAFWLKQKDHR
ncbi:MAG: hypothetical protein KAT58_07150 [candidate division Zixibacteria bacterium]|nr:hypothetical protein [candidate division Zixibacteria bacterium]